MASQAYPQTYRLGIDVGGTNTDAVILDAADQVIASVKSPTTIDITTGIVNALQAVLATAQVPPQTIRYAMLGTTHCTNAIVTRQGLSRVGVIRLGPLPPTQSNRCSLGRTICARSSIHTLTFYRVDMSTMVSNLRHLLHRRCGVRYNK